MAKKLLIVIDYQKDFVNESAKNIDTKLVSKINKYINDNNDIKFLIDTHFKEEWDKNPQSKYIDEHCILGTDGWELYGGLNKFNKLNSDKFSLKSGYVAAPAIVTSLFLDEQYESIEFCGIYTETSILQNIIVFYNTLVLLSNSPNLKIDLENFKFIVDSECCVAKDDKNQDVFLSYMKDILNVEILNSNI